MALDVDDDREARYREPYNTRHSFVSWNLMLGKNLLWVARQDAQRADHAGRLCRSD
jgi:hypothetical protein